MEGMAKRRVQLSVFSCLIAFQVIACILGMSPPPALSPPHWIFAEGSRDLDVVRAGDGAALFALGRLARSGAFEVAMVLTGATSDGASDAVIGMEIACEHDRRVGKKFCDAPTRCRFVFPDASACHERLGTTLRARVRVSNQQREVFVPLVWRTEWLDERNKWRL
jgi:hypothetical protein